MTAPDKPTPVSQTLNGKQWKVTEYHAQWSVKDLLKHLSPSGAERITDVDPTVETGELGQDVLDVTWKEWRPL